LRSGLPEISSPPREIPAPRPTAQAHADLELPLEGLGEELAAHVHEPLLQTLVYPMTEDVEEPVLAAGLPDLSGHRTAARSPSDQRSDIDDR
jgi:hypothetical protein